LGGSIRWTAYSGRRLVARASILSQVGRTPRDRKRGSIWRFGCVENRLNDRRIGSASFANHFFERFDP
jgi:hypothetical protein